MKNAGSYFFVAACILAGFISGWGCGYKDGRDNVRHQVEEHALFFIDMHKNNLKNQMASMGDLEKYGWEKAEAMCRSREVGEIKAYSRILREVAK